MKYPIAVDPEKVGTYPATVKAGGGYVWDEALEYRVWCHPHESGDEIEDHDDYYCAFNTYEEALSFSQIHKGAEEPLALILQNEYIEEPENGKYLHIKKLRMTEWSVEFLRRPKRDSSTIPNFMSPNAPPNRLDIIRGLAW